MTTHDEMNTHRVECSSGGEAGQLLMSGRLSFEVEHTHPVAVVRLRGTLDASSANDLRTALLACLAEQPAGVVVDASRLSIVDDVAIAVLATAAQHSERWPGTRFTLAGADPDVVTAANRTGLARYVTICPDHAAALAELGRWPVPPWRRQRISPDREAPSLARAVVQEFCAAQAVGGDRDAAQLVASELVTNAVVHAGTPIDLTVRLVASLLHIAVRDRGDGTPRISDVVDETAESGRGLLLVDALATAWGNFVPDTGKIVWATVRVRPVTPTAKASP